MTLELHAACIHDSMEALPLSTVTSFSYHISKYTFRVIVAVVILFCFCFCAVGIRIDYSTQLVSYDRIYCMHNTIFWERPDKYLMDDSDSDRVPVAVRA
jgi:hypothetical protein